MALAAFSKACSDRTAGIATIYFIDAADLTSMTLATGSTSVYGVITLGSAKKFFTYQFEEDMAEFREVISRENNSTLVTHEVELFLPKMEATTQVAIQALVDSSACGLICVLVDSNGTKWVVGYNEAFLKSRPLRVISATGGTGKLLNDLNGSTIILGCKAKKTANTTTASIVIV